MNSVTVPRLPAEAVGGICKLKDASGEGRLSQHTIHHWKDITYSNESKVIKGLGNSETIFESKSL